jgi:hypothetical protein
MRGAILNVIDFVKFGTKLCTLYRAMLRSAMLDTS